MSSSIRTAPAGGSVPLLRNRRVLEYEAVSTSMANVDNGLIDRRQKCILVDSVVRFGVVRCAVVRLPVERFSLVARSECSVIIFMPVAVLSQSLQASLIRPDHGRYGFGTNPHIPREVLRNRPK